MIKDFFKDKFEYDFLSNKKWIEHLAEHEEKLSPYILKSMSHIINVHHIWIYRIQQKKQESFTWDLLPIDFWLKLAQENYLQTIEFLENIDFEEKINYHDEEGVEMERETIDILYHILQHNTYHRGQIAHELKSLNLPVPIFNFISYTS